jgi:NADH:ubiquinone oxidoreductase subunit F (NADH-binding)/NADH:ubiquinone oxidoreductase subunit E
MALIKELYKLQSEHGYLRSDDLRELAGRLRVPLYRLEGLASFYPHFRNTPPPRVQVGVCRDMSCHLNGAARFTTALHEALDGAGDVEVESVSCLGRCDNAPAACINGRPLPAAAPEAVTERARQVAEWARNPGSLPVDTGDSTSGRTWRIDPYDDSDQQYGILRGLPAGTDTAAVRLDDRQADGILTTLEEAGLRGMGGAGFPTATKWRLVREQTATPRYVVVNADESEPGTFKDRVILAELPHLVVEGAAVAARVVGAERVIIYLRHEYEPEHRVLAAEIDRAREAGVLPVPVEIFISPGGYILGEETALLEALEDRRGEPRNKPPFPVSHGLYGKPTVINNVETLAMVPAILSHGATWWHEQGVGESAGLKFISVSGHIARPGVHEIPLGLPLSRLLDDAGGISGGRSLAAVAPGGASSNFLPPDAVSTPLDFKAMEAAGSMLGSGAVVVMADGTDLVAVAANVVAFFRNESCGKCVPCRTGTEKAVRLLDDLQAGRGNPAQVALLPQLGETLRLTSICGLGQVALNPILSLLDRFPEVVATLTRESGSGD